MDTSQVTHELEYRYDMLGELTYAKTTNINGSTWEADYTYHKDGNLDDRSVTHNSVTENDHFNYTADSDLISDIDGAGVSWDNNGNMVAGLTSSLTWNWDNHLREGFVGADTLDCVYAPSGEMIYKETYVDGLPGVTTKRKFIVDTTGNYPMILMELAPDGGGGYTIEKTYINANGQTLMQRNGSQAANDDRYFYLHDRLGNVRALIDTGGDMVNCYVYDPFGNSLDVSGETQETIENRFRFAGYKWDKITEMYNCNARWYDPDLARFTGRDPVLGNFQEPLTLHAYLYCLNDPINAIDPTGEILGPLGTQGLRGRMEASVAAAGTRAMAFAGRIYLAAAYRAMAINAFIANYVIRGEAHRYGNPSRWRVHFHLPWGPGLKDHHLPEQFPQWWKNFKAVWDQLYWFN